MAWRRRRHAPGPAHTRQELWIASVTWIERTYHRPRRQASPGRLHALQCGGEVRRPGRQNGQPLVEIAADGGGRQAVVTGELEKTGAVDEPAQDEHRLPEAAESTPPLTSPGRDAVIAQRTGQMLGGGPLRIEHGGVPCHLICDLSLSCRTFTLEDAGTRTLITRGVRFRRRD